MMDYDEAKEELCRSLDNGVDCEELLLDQHQVGKIAAWLAGEGFVR
jgi:hypothetical protein